MTIVLPDLQFGTCCRETQTGTLDDDQFNLRTWAAIDNEQVTLRCYVIDRVSERVETTPRLAISAIDGILNAELLNHSATVSEQLPRSENKQWRGLAAV